MSTIEAAHNQRQATRMTDEPEFWQRSVTLTVPERARRFMEKVMRQVRARPSDSMNDIQHLQRATTQFMAETVSDYVRRCYGTTVQSGPFKGMAYLARASGSQLSPKILGTYEQELEFAIEALADCKLFLDVGCAEGYFAVGAAYRFPDLKVRAYDIEARARDDCAEMAALNAVDGRVEIGAGCTASDIEAADSPETLVMLDIEGAEVDLLAALDARSVARTRFIIEIHDVPGPDGRRRSTADDVRACFAETHDITVVIQGTRDTRLFPELLGLSELQRYLAVWEGRGSHPWMWVTPKAT